MATTWGTNSKGNTNKTSTGTTLSAWSRQQKIAMIASLVLLGLLLAMSACSKQESKPALVGVSGTSQAAAPAVAAATTPATPVPPAETKKKKVQKKRPANVNFSEPNYGVSFTYPRKYELNSGEKVQHELVGNDVRMNFIQPGGVAVASVGMPETSYPGTDFSAALFSVNVNYGLSEQECSQFAFVDHRNPDGEPMDPDQVEVGSMKFSRTSDFNGSMMKQAETEYFHSYENGACYEFVLGLGTEGFGSQDGIEPVNRDEIFAKLEKILATVKIKAIEQEKPQVAAKAEATAATEEAAK
jgi:hypothetical protein